MTPTCESLDLLRRRLGERDLAPGTIERCEIDAAQFAEWYHGTTGQDFDPALVVSIDLAEWLGHLKRRGLKPSSLTRKSASLRTVFRLLAPERLEQLRFPRCRSSESTPRAASHAANATASCVPASVCT